MRTQDEIVARYEERQKKDFLGFETSEYLEALDFEHARPFLRDDAPPDVLEELKSKLPILKSRDDVMRTMREYVDFAYEKIDGERGISANRTVLHYIAWLWLAGEDELLAWVEREYNENYHGYGRHIVDEIVRRLDLRNAA